MPMTCLHINMLINLNMVCFGVSSICAIMANGRKINFTETPLNEVDAQIFMILGTFAPLVSAQS